MRHHTVGELAKLLNAEVVGDETLVISGIAEPDSAAADQIAVAMSKTFADKIVGGNAVCAVLQQDANWQSYDLKAAILVPRPRLAMAMLTELFQVAADDVVAGINSTAIIDPTAIINENAYIGPYAVVSAGASIASGCRIGSHSTIGKNSSLGAGSVLEAGVHISANVKIGSGFLGHPGTVIGSDGFSFVTPEPSNVENVRQKLEAADSKAKEQAWIKISSLGGVEIGDDVEVGPNSSIDAGTIRPTKIGSGTKIDSLVQIGHNVTVGRNCLICGMAGIAGSATVGDNVVLGGRSGVADNIFVGDNAVAAGGSKIVSNVPEGRAVMGYPAVKMESFIESYKALRRLPRLFKDVKKLQERLAKYDDKA